MEESKSRAVRTIAVVRPPQPSEEQIAGLVSIEQLPQSQGYAIKCGAPQAFTFPSVYGYQAEDLDLLCQREVEPCLQGCFAGESAAIMAYGQTGSGKSYLCGTEFRTPDPWSNSVGAYISRRVFEIAKQRKLNRFTAEMSFIEIYREGSSKEIMLDLLAAYNRVPLQGYAGGSIHQVTSAEEMLNKLVAGSGLRNTDSTDGNARSSRSHAIMSLTVRHIIVDASGRSQLISGKILMADLAGAEAASAAVANTTQQRQGSGINVGLSALQLVIREVAEQGKTLHYRDSKLTHLLKPALGGEGGRQGCNALFIGCVSPSLADAKRTQHTLQYMQQAGRIRNYIEANVEMLEAKREAALLRERDALKARLQAMAAELTAVKETAAAGKVGAGVNASMAPLSPLVGVRAEDVVVLTVKEHQELLARRDAAAALEVVVQKDEERFAALKRELEASREAVEAAERKLKRKIEEDKDAAAASSLGDDFSLATPAAGPSSGLLPPKSSTAAIAGPLSPAMAALSVSPILSAAGGAGDEVYDYLTLEEICIPSDVSNLAPEQFEVLQKLVAERLQRFGGDLEASPPSVEQQNSIAGLQTLLRRRTAEVSALRLAVASYNECLGSMASDLALARDSEREALAQLHQAAREKVQYVELVAKYQQALDLSQYDVLELQGEVDELKKQHTPLQGHFTGGASSSGGGLLSRLMGRAPASPPPASPSRSPQQSPVPSPVSSPQKPKHSPAARTTRQSDAETSGGGGAGPSTAQTNANLGGLDTAERPVKDQSKGLLNVPGSSGGGGGDVNLNPFPLADLEEDEYNDDVLGRETSLVDLVADQGNGSTGAEANTAEQGSVSNGAVVDLTQEEPEKDKPRRTLQNNHVVAATRQEKELQKSMAGGIDVGAISNTRTQQVAKDYAGKNSLWKAPFQKLSSSTSSRRSKK